MSEPMFTWSIDFGPMLNKKVEVTTREGFVRLATLTDVRYFSLSINSIEIDCPDEIVLNNDDVIPFAQIKSMSLVGSAKVAG